MYRCHLRPICVSEHTIPRLRVGLIADSDEGERCFQRDAEQGSG
jgi:hypothetical protein